MAVDGCLRSRGLAQRPLRSSPLRGLLVVLLLSTGGLAQTKDDRTEPEGVLSAPQWTEADIARLIATIDPSRELRERIDAALSAKLHAIEERSIAEQLGFEVGFRLQLRLNYEAILDDDELAFDIARARLQFGFRLREFDLRARILLNLIDQPDDRDGPAGTVSLKEGLVEWTPDDLIAIRAGQFAAPSTRQRAVSTARLLFLERSVFVDRYAYSRSPGVSVRVAGSALGAEAGLFEGDGENAANPREGLLFPVRLAVHPFGPPPLDDAAKDPGEEDFALEVAGFASRLEASGRTVEILGADLALHHERFTLRAAAALREDSRRDDTERGLFAQVSYAISPAELEIAASGARTWAGGRPIEDELLASLTWFQAGHDRKWQLEAGWLREEGDPRSLLVRLQYQFAF